MSEWHLYERWLSRPKQLASQHLILFAREHRERLKEATTNPRLSTAHVVFHRVFWTGRDVLAWGDFVNGCRGFTRLSFEGFCEIRCWCVPAEIESWRYLFSCTHVYLSISSYLDQHSCIYRNSRGGVGGVTPGNCTVSQCWPVQLHWSSRRFNVGSRMTALEISTLYPSVWADELRGRTVRKCIQRAISSYIFPVNYTTDRCFFVVVVNRIKPMADSGCLRSMCEKNWGHCM